MKIQVRDLSDQQDITVQAGYMTDEVHSYFVAEYCNHAGAEWQDVIDTTLSFDEGYGNYLPSNETFEELVCDKCNKYYDEGAQEWI